MAVDIGKQPLTLDNKVLGVQVGTEVPVVALANKTSLFVTGKYFEVIVGNNTPFIGLTGRTTLPISGKQIFVVNGFQQSINKSVLIPEYKLLQYSTVVVPDMVELDRLFVLKAPTTIYLLRDI